MQAEPAVYADKVCCVCEQSSRCMQAEPAVNTLEKYTQRSINSAANKMSEDWDILMKESSTGTWFQSEEAWRFYCACAEWLTPFHTEVKRGERIVGMVTGYITKEQRTWKQRFSCRAVINGGPLLAADATTEEVKTLLIETEAEVNRLSKGQIIYIETRNFVDLSPWREAFEQAGWEYKAHYDIHVDCRDEERLWQRIHESKRRTIKAADSLFFSVRSNSSPSKTDAPCVAPPTPTDPSAGTQLFLRDSIGAPCSAVSALAVRQENNIIGEWYAMLEELYKTKVHRPLWPQAFFERAIEMGVGELLVVYANKVRGVCEQSSRCMQAEPAVNTIEYTQQSINSDSIHSDSIHSEAFTVQQGVGKIMGGMFVVKDEKRVYEWYVVGSVPVTYAGLKYATETGREVFDFMGAGEPGKPYGVRDFKMQFGGELKELGRWIRVCKRGYYNLGKLIVNANILG